jgi:uncharacterized Zn-finger protein
MIHTGTALPNDKPTYEITKAQLPLHCPLPEMSLWNSHPRVFLAIEDAPDGKIRCPYCGTEYILVSQESVTQVAA